MLKSRNNPKTTEITVKIISELEAESFAHEESRTFGCYECGTMIHNNMLNAINQAFKDANMTIIDYFADLKDRGLTYKFLYEFGLLQILDGLLIPYDAEDRAVGEILKDMPTSLPDIRARARDNDTMLTDKEIPF